MASQPLFSIASWILLAGALLLQFLVILSGAVPGSPENQIFFLQTSTAGIPDAPNPARWTYFALCAVNPITGLNTDCRHRHPAFPFAPTDRRNFGTDVGVPAGIVAAGNRWWYLSRFGWVFYMFSLTFGTLGLVTGVLAVCARLGAYVSALNTAIAAGFQAVAAALITAWIVQGRDAFRAAGFESTIGVKALAFTWTAFACYFLSTILYCLAGASSKYRSSYDPGRSGVGLFSRNRHSVISSRSHKSQLSRGSFVGSERGIGGREIMNDYS